MKKGEKACLVLRWRRFPLTRELLLLAKDGSEFTLLADVRTPWEEQKLEETLLITEQDQAKILAARISDDALPASLEACRITVPPIDKMAWAKANK